MINLNEEIIKVCLKIAKRGEGALIVVGEAKYKPLVNQDVQSFDVIKNPKLLESLALMDGAVIVNQDGMMEAYGVKINGNLTIKNFGTRHSAGVNASLKKGTTAYLVSEEESKIKVFKEGREIAQIDALQKGIEKNVSTVSKILEGIGIGTVETVGASLLIPNLGLSLIPGVIIFGGAYLLINKIKEWSGERWRILKN